MRIDGTSGLGAYGPNGQGNPRAGKVGDETTSRRARPAPPAKESADPRHLARARAAEPIDASAVAEARRLLRAGQLDTPEAVARLAQGLAHLGT